MTMIKKCLFPAAGYGTRFLPATKSMPKEMLPVVDKPLIQYGVEEAMQAGMNNIAIVTGRGKRALAEGDPDRLSTDAAGFLGGQERDRLGDLLHRRDAAGRIERRPFLPDLVGRDATLFRLLIRRTERFPCRSCT
mgnify:CR=1 FL=1